MTYKVGMGILHELYFFILCLKFLVLTKELRTPKHLRVTKRHTEQEN